MNLSALKYWRHTGYTTQDILDVCREIDGSRLAAKVDIFPGEPIGITITNHVADTGQGHAISCLRFLQKVLDHLREQGTELRGSLLLWLEDGVWEWDHHHAKHAPLLTFSRRFDDTYSLLIPDPAFMDQGYAREREQIDERDVSWGDKRPTLFWRGASSGLGMNSNEWMKCERITLALESKRLGKPHLLDAKISLVDVAPECPAYQGIYDLELIGEYLDFYDFLSYRYLIDVDGHSCAWRSLFLKLHSLSTVVKVRGDHVQWYYDRLFPWVHYVPVRSDSRDIVEVYEWLRRNDNAAREIAVAGRGLTREITLQSAIKETGQLLVELLRSWKGPTRE